MGIDIRIPIGGMFSIIGVLLVVFGLATHGSPMYAQHSLGFNVNLWWGLALLVFGGLMLYFGRRAESNKPSAPDGDT